MGGRAVDADEVFFDNYRAPVDTLIGEEGQGFKTVRWQFAHPTIFVMADRCRFSME